MSRPPFTGSERAGVYRAIYERRDVRSYRPDPIPDATLATLLRAAHRAPSVGFMQPWGFVLVRDRGLRQRVYQHFVAANEAAAQVYQGERKAAYRSLKLQGILDAPLNLVVTCDPSRGGEHVLGRHSMPQMDEYSTCLAVQNLWLAARAEGLGVGWMSIMQPKVVAELLGIPQAIKIVAYLTLGYPVELAEEPLLSQVGWRHRLPLADLVYEDRWATPSSLGASLSDAPGAATSRGAARAVDALEELSPDEVQRLSQQRNQALLKPVGSLGKLEQLALQLAKVQGRVYPRCDAPRLCVFAADHGVAVRGVSAYERETTLKLVYSMLAEGAVVNALARSQRVPVTVIDVGVDHDFADARGLVHAKVRRGSRDFLTEPAMTSEECEVALGRGREAVDALSPLDVLLLGEVGIGNTTSAAALTCGLLGLSPRDAVGRGTGVDDASLLRKRHVVERACALHADCGDDATAWLRCVGGLELAALVGAMEAAAERGVPVVLDGFIVGAAALVAARRRPELVRAFVAAHQGAEPGHSAQLRSLGLSPLLTLDLRLGEGSGAALALGLVRAACAVMAEVRTFEEANIERPERRRGP